MSEYNKKKILTPLQRLLGEDFDFPVFLYIVRKTMPLVVGLIMVSFAIAFLYLRYTPSVYQITTRLIYKQSLAQQTFDIFDSKGQSVFGNIEIIRSPIILRPVLEVLPLSVGYFERGRSNLFSTEYYRNSPFLVTSSVNTPGVLGKDIEVQLKSNTHYKLRYEMDSREYVMDNLPYGQVAETPHFDLILDLAGGMKGKVDNSTAKREFYFRLYDEQMIISSIVSKLTITTYTRGGQILQIDMRDILTNRAMDILNEISQVYIKYDVIRQQQSAENVLSFIDDQIDTITRELQMYESSIKDFKLEKRVSDPHALTNRVLEGITGLEQRQLDLAFEIEMLNWLENFVRQGQRIATLAPELVDLQYKGYLPFLQRIRDMQQQIDDLQLSLKDDHLQIRYMREQLAEATNDLYENLNIARKRLELQLTYLDQDLRKFNQEFEGLSSVEAEFITLSRVKNNIEKFYLSLLDKRTEYEIRKASIVENFQVLERASHGLLVAPRKRLLQLGSIGLGLFMGLSLIVGRYLLQNKIQTVQEVEEHSEVPMIGVVPSHKHKRPEESIMVFNHPKSVITEAFRSLRSNLDFIPVTHEKRMVAVTSSISGEGKTFVSVNLAAVLSMAGKRVVLLDLDMRRPKLHKVFKVQNLQGMSTILIGRQEPEACVVRIDERLDLIPSGPLPPNPAELILSPRMKEVIDKLRETYDYVVCDTPPFGMVSDSLELIKAADYPIYVLRHDYSKREFINLPNKLYHESGVRNLAIVLNDVHLKRSGYGRYNYGYSYGYGYRYGYGRGYFSEDGTPGRPWWQRLFSR